MGWFAVLTGVFATYVQYRRVRNQGVEGVSLATWVLFVYMGGFWMSYGVVARSAEVILGSLLVLPMQLSILFRLRPWERLGVPARALAYFVACCVLPTLLWGWAGGVYGTGVAMTLNRVPQLIELVRHEDASGVSASSWYIGTAGSALWIVYYLGAHLWAALVATACAGLANLVIAMLATWRHRMAQRELVAELIFAT